MLCIARSPGEYVEVVHNGETMKVYLLESRSKVAKIGFDGPTTFRVCRSDAKNKAPRNREAVQQ